MYAAANLKLTAALESELQPNGQGGQNETGNKVQKFSFDIEKVMPGGGSVHIGTKEMQVILSPSTTVDMVGPKCQQEAIGFVNTMMNG